jgi:hypothetical protein
VEEATFAIILRKNNQKKYDYFSSQEEKEISNRWTVDI